MTRGQIYESEVLGIRIVLEKKGEEVIGSVEYPSHLDQFASAVHIHKNVGGTPGPILSWLCTSKEWDSGVLQNTPGKKLSILCRSWLLFECTTWNSICI